MMVHASVDSIAQLPGDPMHAVRRVEQRDDATAMDTGVSATGHVQEDVCLALSHRVEDVVRYQRLW